MANRLRKTLRAIPFLCGICLCLLPARDLVAQSSFFNVPPLGNVDIPVGANCTVALQGNITPPVVTSTVGATIVVSMFDAAASGFALTDLWAVGTGIPVVWYVEDNQGHSYSFNYLIAHTVDATPPTFDLTSVPTPLVVNSIVQVPTLGPLPATDNCTASNNLVQTFSQTAPPDTCDAGTFTRTWRVTDQAGNTRTYTQTIQVTADVQPPAIGNPVPMNGSSPCSALPGAYQSWLATQMAAFNATDASGIRSLTNNAPANFPPGCPAPLTVTFRATDNCSLFMTRTATFTTSDTQAPSVVVAPKDTVAYCTPAGSPLTKLAEWISTRGYSTVADACTAVTYRTEINASSVDSAQIVSALLASYSNGCMNKIRGKVTVAWFARDACGNEIPAGQATFSVRDTLAPIITGSNITEECGTTTQDNSALQNWINAHGNASVTDECSETSWDNFSFVTSTGQTGTGFFNSGPYPQTQAHNCNWWVDVTFRAFDGCGNLGSKTLRFQIEDNTDPVISGFPNPVTLACPNPVPTLPKQFVTDNCDTSMVITNTIVRSDSLCDGSYTMTVTWSAMDDCGNMGTAIQTVLVRDTVAPVFTLVPGNKTFRCDTFQLPPAPVMGIGITATDNCSPVTSITTQDVSNQSADPQNCAHYSYQITRTFTASDECGNTRTATQVLSIVDNQGPVFSGFADTTGVCDVAPILPKPTATDACNGVISVIDTVGVVTTPGTCADAYTLTITWTAQDVCNNATTFSQDIAISDTVRPTLTNIPPDVTVACDAIPTAPSVNTFNATDNCDDAVAVAFLETELRNPDPANCDHWTNYVIRREWTASDNCGNTRSYTQNILIQDNTPPVLTPPASLALPNDAGDCGADVTIPAPVSVFDICTSLPVAVTLRDTALLVNTSGGPNGTTPVDTVVFQWNTPNTTPAAPVTANAMLRVYLENADADNPSETFKILGENNTVLGTTTLVTPAQCGSGFTDVTITALQLNNWLMDGVLTLRLAPNGAGGNAVNAVCPGGGRARANLTYTYSNPQVPIQLQYMLDGNPPAAYPAAGPVFLPPGVHTVVYIATDCAGNETTASSTITVTDQEPPVVIPPATQTVYVQSGECEAVVSLPFPTISDNCDVSGSLTQASAILPLQFVNDPNAGLIPGMISLNITGLVPNAVGSGILKIRHKGDNDQTGEFFKVLDENNVSLGQTSLGPTSGVCSEFHESTIVVTAAQINAWAANGTTTIRLMANNEAGTFTEFIGPCGPLLPDQTDGISRVQAVLEYSFAVVTYEVRNSGNQLVQTGGLNGQETAVILSPDTYTVKYLTTDTYGLEGSASFQVIVRDTIRPTAVCKDFTIINVNPSGAPGTNYALQVSEIDNGSFDNCTELLTYQLSQTSFPCSSVGSNVTVTLTATDAYGNSSTCTTLVKVDVLAPVPTHDPVCEGGTLRMFANPPAPANAFSYFWNFSAGSYSSTLQNPIRTNAQLSYEGAYYLTVTGLTGCTATAILNVDLANLPTQPQLQALNPTPCSGENIQLITPTYGGTNVTYQWYLGEPAVLQATVPQNTFTLTEAAPGTYKFYVKVLADGCTSINSEVVTVEVKPRPLAVIMPDPVNVCEGQPIVLTTTSQGVGMTYLWTGPAGYGPFVTQFPPPISNATALNAGTYTLIVTQDGCVSKPATVPATVRPKPPKPLISGSNQVCEGATVILLANTPTAAQYIWDRPAPNLDTITPANSITLPNIMVADSGTWRVQVMQQGCLSDWSDPLHIGVQAYPEVTATNTNVSVCAGDVLPLSATGNPTNLNWMWTGPSGFTSFQRVVDRNPAVAGQYVVIGKTSYGCADTAFVNAQVVPIPIIDSIVVNAPICSDMTTDATLTPYVSSIAGNLSFEWKGPNGQVISNDSILVIPDVSTVNNGSYTLTVRTQIAGNTFCSSVLKTTTISVGPPLVLPIITSQPMSVCAGTPVVLSVTNPGQYNPSAKFIWVRPVGGDTMTTQAFLNLSGAPAQSGVYSVYVNDGICQSGTSAPVTVSIFPIPVAPVISSNTPVCEGDVLQLFSNLIPGATYAWTGPAGSGFSSASQNPTVSPVTMSNVGTYRLKVTVNGCISPESTTEVEIVARPKKPSIITPLTNRICIDQPGASLTLTLTNITPGSQFFWINESNDTIKGPLNSVTATWNGVDTLFTPGPHTFRAFAWRNGCDSQVSDPMIIFFDTIPNNTAFAGVDGPICVIPNEPIHLAAAPLPTGSTGFWTQVGSLPVTIAEPGNPHSLVNNASAGNIYRFAWSLSSGGCMNYSRDTVTLTANALELANAGADIYSCSVVGIRLNAVQGNTVAGVWKQPDSQAGLGIVIDTILHPQTTISGNGLTPGNRYYFQWNMSNPGCPTQVDEVVVHIYSQKPNAGPDQFLCNNEDCTLLNASDLAVFESGVWTSTTPSVTFTTPSSDQTTVCGLQPGQNIMRWTTNGGVCGENSYDEVLVNFELRPTANPDAVDVLFGTPTTVSVLPNDVVSTQFNVEITVMPTHGRVETTGIGIYTYQPNTGFSGTDQMEYGICNPRCPEDCSYTTVVFNVLGPGDCFLPNLITPNGDGLNDAFIIPETCIAGAGKVEVELTIFNQWGDQVFHASPYENDWEGTYNGNPLPVGTYFYVVQFSDPLYDPKKGFLIIQR